jgi:glycosyltransferase involved in cell wall biosynthesis
MASQHTVADTALTTGPRPHICVCACTFKRPDLLLRLLEGLEDQKTHGRFTYSILIVDNDRLRSAEAMVAHFAASSALNVRYCVEPRQNIAMARNTAIANAKGDFVAFIDDDEVPIAEWLATLLEACMKYSADGALGPVKPHFDEPPPRWVIDGRFHERSSYPTGMVIDWRQGRTGNVLLRRHVFEGWEQPFFRPEYRNGEDQEFFHRIISRDHVFVWCDEAVAYEVVPPVRWKRSVLLKRALLRGAMEPRMPDYGPRALAKSLIAVPVYTFALPLALLAGQARFMSLLVRLCDHLGKLLAAAGCDPVKEQYVTE